MSISVDKLRKAIQKQLDIDCPPVSKLKKRRVLELADEAGINVMNKTVSQLKKEITAYNKQVCPKGISKMKKSELLALAEEMELKIQPEAKARRRSSKIPAYPSYPVPDLPYVPQMPTYAPPPVPVLPPLPSMPRPALPGRVEIKSAPLINTTSDFLSRLSEGRRMTRRPKTEAELLEEKRIEEKKAKSRETYLKRKAAGKIKKKKAK